MPRVQWLPVGIYIFEHHFANGVILQHYCQKYTSQRLIPLNSGITSFLSINIGLVLRQIHKQHRVQFKTAEILPCQLFRHNAQTYVHIEISPNYLIITIISQEIQTFKEEI